MAWSLDNIKTGDDVWVKIPSVHFGAEPRFAKITVKRGRLFFSILSVKEGYVNPRTKYCIETGKEHSGIGYQERIVESKDDYLSAFRLKKRQDDLLRHLTPCSVSFTSEELDVIQDIYNRALSRKNNENPQE